MNDSQDFQDAESVRSGNSHVTSRPVSQRRAAMHLGHTWKIGKRFCRSTCIFISSLSSMHQWNSSTEKQSSIDATKDSDKHILIWRIFLSLKLQAWWRITQTICIPSKKNRSYNETDVLHIWEIGIRTISWDFSSEKINWENFSWQYVSNWWWTSHQWSAHKSPRMFNSVLCLWKINENPRSNIAWEERLTWFKSSSEYRTLDGSDGEPMEFEWNILPGFTSLQLSYKVQELLLRLEEHQRILQDGLSSCRCSTTSHGDQKTTRKNTSQMLNSFPYSQKRFEAGQWSFLGPGSEKKWYSISEFSPQGECDKMTEKMMVKLAESGHPVSRVTSPLSRGVLKRKGGEKCRSTIVPSWNRSQLFSHIYFCKPAQSLRDSRWNM